MGLSQGTFDGLITTYETVASGQFWESGIRHALEDHQFIGEYIPVVSLAFWQKLPPDLQQAFTELWREKIAAYRAEMAAAQSRAREFAEAHGIKIVVPSPRRARSEAPGDDGASGPRGEAVEDLARDGRAVSAEIAAAG